jgi:hypothetical protein
MPAMENDVSHAFHVMPSGYLELFDRLRSLSLADDRIRGMWLGGSIARGEQDQSSDLDVFVAVADESFDQFATGWRDWLATITPTVIARQLPFALGSFYCVTPTMERLDIVSEPVRALTDSFHRVRLLVFDKDSLHGLLPSPFPVAGPSPVAIAGIIEEFFRDYALFHTVVDRQDWLLGLEAIQIVRTLLYKLFVESNAPVTVTGIKRWSEKLTVKQRRVLESLPAAKAEREEVLAVHEAVSLAFRAAALEVAARYDVAWPAELERVVCESLKQRGLPHLSLS